MGGGREATHRLLSLAPAVDHSPHPPPRPRARDDLILCWETPPCPPGVLHLQTGLVGVGVGRAVWQAIWK